MSYIDAPSFPCVGARAALHRDRMRFVQAGQLGSDSSTPGILSALYAFQQEFPEPGADPVSFVAIFASASEDERGFEQRMWQQLWSLHQADKKQFGWDPTVSMEASSERFSFSLGGRGMFIVGLHPQASRLSRQAPADTLVFNLHQQFEDLRANGKYESMQRVIRKRDIALQGSINPVLARFGEASEALQYSGRTQPSKCPFHFGGGAN